MAFSSLAASFLGKCYRRVVAYNRARGRRSAIHALHLESAATQVHGVEPLEPRVLLSGVTLVTHGFGSDVTGWVQSVTDSIAGRINGTHADLLIVAQDTGNGLEFTAQSSGDPRTCTSGEILVRFDWSDLAGSINPFNWFDLYSTPTVASGLADFLLDPGLGSDWRDVLVASPIHLIGHSRGGSLVSALAQELGERGLWVEHVTTLDPHPVDGVNEPLGIPFIDFGDANPTHWNNVVFWDNYWRTDGLHSLDFTGQSVPGAYNLQLSEAVLTGAGSTFEHSDVPTWYYGTVDTTSPSVPASWYEGTMGPRSSLGYAYSRIAGNARPLSGIPLSFNGASSSTPVALDTSLDLWPNIGMLALPGTSFAVGSSIDIGFLYQDYDTAPTVRFYLDTDENPYNDNSELIGTAGWPQTWGEVSEQSQEVYLDGTANQDYFVYASITGGPHVRYAYAPQPIHLTDVPYGDALTSSFAESAQIWHDDGPPNGNNNDRPESGEKDLSLKLRLDSNADIYAISARLVSVSSDVVVQDEEIGFMPISAGGSQWSDGSWDIDFNFPADQIRHIALVLQVTYKKDDLPYRQDVTLLREIRPPGMADFSKVNPTLASVDDAVSIYAGNDGDGVLESGEKARIKVRVTNSGNDPATGAEMWIVEDTDAVSINPSDDEALDPSPVLPGQTATTRGTITVEVARSTSGRVRVSPYVIWDEIQRDADPLNDVQILQNLLWLDIGTAPWLGISDRDVNFGVVSPGDPVEIPITLRNDGTATLHITGFQYSDPRLSMSGAPTTINASDPDGDQITINLNTTGLTGQFTGKVTILSDSRTDPGDPFEITITGLVSNTWPVCEIPHQIVEEQADVAGDWIAYRKDSGGNGDIYAYNLRTATEWRLTSHPADARVPRISGNLVAWLDFRNYDSVFDNYDVYGFDLSRPDLGEFLIVGSPRMDRLIGVDNGRIAVEQTYEVLYDRNGQPDEFATNLLVYQYTGNGQVSQVFTTGWTPGSGTAMRRSLCQASWGDFGGDMLAVQTTDWVWAATTYPHWDNTNAKIQVINFARTPSPPYSLRVTCLLTYPYDIAAVAGGFYFVEDDTGGDEQIYLWRDNGGSGTIEGPLTSGTTEPGNDSFAASGAIGQARVVYDYGDVGNFPGIYYRDYSHGGVEQAISRNEDPRDARIDGSVVAWEDPWTSRVYYTILDQADLGITTADIAVTPGSPVEGGTAAVTVSVHNLTSVAFSGGGTVGLYNVDPATLGATPLATASLPATIAARGKADIPFAPVGVPVGAEGPYTYWVRISPTGLDSPGNNTASKTVTVNDSDTTGPSGSVQVAELGGDGDGLLGADERIRCSWSFSDPSGVAYVKGYLDGSASPLWDVPGGSGSFDFGPLDALLHTITVVAADGDKSPESTTVTKSVLVVPAEEISLLVDRVPVAAGSTIDFGAVVRGGPGVSKLLEFLNDGEQPLRVDAWTWPLFPHGFSISGPALPAVVDPGESLSFWVTLGTGRLGDFLVSTTLATSDGPRSPDGLNESSFGLTIAGRAMERPPGAPTDLTITAVGASHADLTWADNAGNEDCFTVYYGPTDGGNDPGGWPNHTDVAADTTSWPMSGLASGTTHYFRVCASNAGGSSTLSNVVSAMWVNARHAVPSLNVAAGAMVATAVGGDKAIITGALTIAGPTVVPTGTLDLADNDLVVDYAGGTATSPVAQITRWLASGRNFGAGPWDGSGITSRVARDDAPRITTLGVVDNIDPDGAGPLTPRVPVGGTFAGEVVDDSMVLVKYTYYGDVNFDGAVDAADYALIDNGFNFQNDPVMGAGLRNWANGDMNFDGSIDAADYALIDNAFNFQSGALAGAAGQAESATAASSPTIQPTEQPMAQVAALPAAAGPAALWAGEDADVLSFADAGLTAGTSQPRNLWVANEPEALGQADWGADADVLAGTSALPKRRPALALFA